MKSALVKRSHHCVTQRDVPKAKMGHTALGAGILARWSGAWLCAWLLVAALFAARGSWEPERDSLAGAPTAGVSDFGRGLPPIETICVGQRVVAGNPEVETSAKTAVDPRTWRKLSLRAETKWDDGTMDFVEVVTLQPASWIEEHRADVGATVPLPLHLVEMGLPEDLTAEVTSNQPCPGIESGAGRVVLTTVSSLSRTVCELTIRNSHGQSVTIRPTALHKFYSRDRNQWASARELREGEQIDSIAGALTVLARRTIPGTHRVYNMTVEGEHVYHVSRLGLLAHNDGCAKANPKGTPHAPGDVPDDFPVVVEGTKPAPQDGVFSGSTGPDALDAGRGVPHVKSK